MIGLNRFGYSPAYVQSGLWAIRSGLWRDCDTVELGWRRWRDMTWLAHRQNEHYLRMKVRDEQFQEAKRLSLSVRGLRFPRPTLREG